MTTSPLYLYDFVPETYGQRFICVAANRDEAIAKVRAHIMSNKEGLSTDNIENHLTYVGDCVTERSKYGRRKAYIEERPIDTVLRAEIA